MEQIDLQKDKNWTRSRLRYSLNLEALCDKYTRISKMAGKKDFIVRLNTMEVEGDKAVLEKAMPRMFAGSHIVQFSSAEDKCDAKLKEFCATYADKVVLDLAEKQVCSELMSPVALSDDVSSPLSPELPSSSASSKLVTPSAKTKNSAGAVIEEKLEHRTKSPVAPAVKDGETLHQIQHGKTHASTLLEQNATLEDIGRQRCTSAMATADGDFEWNQRSADRKKFKLKLPRSRNALRRRFLRWLEACQPQADDYIENNAILEERRDCVAENMRRQQPAESDLSGYRRRRRPRRWSRVLRKRNSYSGKC